jgi:monoamine oxidase
VSVERVRVAVIGAGLSGLAAARRLGALGVGPVAVLEGGSRAGGRAVSLPRAEVEGLSPPYMYVRRDDRTVLDLAGSLDVPTEEIVHDTSLADLRVDASGGTAESEDNLPVGLPWWTRLRGEYVMDRFHHLCEDIDPVEPWRSPRAERLDAQTAYSWLRQHSSDPRILRLVEERLTSEVGLPSGRVSLLWLLAHVGRDPVGEVPLLRVDPGLLVRRAQTGVRTGHRVDRVDQDGEGVRLHGDWGSLAADRVILALSPADAHHIEFAPRLSARRRLMHQHWPQTEVVQTELVYWRPFWRRFGLSGTAHFEEGVPAWTLDDSPVDSSHGRLVARTYTFGESAPLGADQDVVEDAAAHREMLLEHLGQAFGPLAAKPLAIAETSRDGSARNASYRSPTPPGFLTEYGPLLRAPVGRLHWAATETAPFPANGDLGGALSSGYRAAQEVARALGDGVLGRAAASGEGAR